MLEMKCDICEKVIESDEYYCLEEFNKMAALSIPTFCTNFSTEEDGDDEWDYQEPETFQHLCNDCRKQLHEAITAKIDDMRGFKITD